MTTTFNPPYFYAMWVNSRTAGTVMPRFTVLHSRSRPTSPLAARGVGDPHRLTIGVGHGLVAAFIAVGDGAVGLAFEGEGAAGRPR